MKPIKEKIIRFLRWSEKYTKTDMLYLAKGGFWQVFNKGIVFLIGIGTMSALARFLPKEIYGTYKYVLSLVSIAGLFTLPAMSKAIVRAVARKKEGELLKATKEKIKFSFFGVGLTLLVSFWYFWQGNSFLGSSFLIASFLFPLPRIFNPYTAFWHGRKRFDVNARHNILVNFFEALVFIPVIYFFDDLLVIFLGYFVSRAIFRGLAFFVALKSVSNDDQAPGTLSFGKHLTLMQAASTFANKIDKVIIWQFLGPLQVAIYSFAQLPVTKFRSFLPISTISLPKLSEKSIKKIKKPLLGKFKKLFLLSLPAAVLFYLLAPYFYQFLFPQYTQSVAFARLLAILIVLAPFSLLQTALVAEMQKRALYAVRFIGPTLKVVLFLALIPFFDVWGIVMAILISELIKSGVVYYYFVKI